MFAVEVSVVSGVMFNVVPTVSSYGKELTHTHTLTFTMVHFAHILHRSEKLRLNKVSSLKFLRFFLFCNTFQCFVFVYLIFIARHH